MSAKVETKKFGKSERSVPHHSEKAQKWYAAEDENKARKVRSTNVMRLRRWCWWVDEGGGDNKIGFGFGADRPTVGNEASMIKLHNVPKIMPGIRSNTCEQRQLQYSMLNSRLTSVVGTRRTRASTDGMWNWNWRSIWMRNFYRGQCAGTDNIFTSRSASPSAPGNPAPPYSPVPF